MVIHNGYTLPGGAGALTSPDPLKPEFPIGQILVEMHIFEWQGITASVYLDWWEIHIAERARFEE
ncbi:hypothetical protein BHYA_0302g00020 [Botrytis hyacinthi]|uniref:Uncharacterized protein n=1 Tax=Botrytis hyacinthi TaxID=278943 RepID=A0A4Z1G6L1_9HELO|nr:hypothetical protein BHYA_0302g00020 [Botrytis hyacinthi]